MNDPMWEHLVDTLREKGLEFDSGLTDAEVQDVEQRFAFRFPPDLRSFLQAGLPRGKEFPDWRTGNEAHLHEWLDIPRRGVQFDVDHGFWLEEWGDKPDDDLDVKAVVTQLIASAPRLIPIYAHRMMPDHPHSEGNPVFSVHQTDIIYYGVDLRDYLIHEFLMTERGLVWPIPQSIRKIEFWDIDRFQDVRWGSHGICAFDNSRGILP